MSDLVLLTHEKNGLRYELYTTELDPEQFANAGFGQLEAMHVSARIRVTSVDQVKQGT